jgi:hypothetical protein
MPRYNFHTHGVSTIVESPDRAAEILHAGWGTLVRQSAATTANGSNWFHLPLTAPVVMTGDDSVILKSIRVIATANENACIREVHVREADHLKFQRDVNWAGPQINQVLAIAPAVPVGGFDPFYVHTGLTLSLRVEFLTGTLMGEIIFRSAGVEFEI